MHFLPHVAQLDYLIFDFVLELGDQITHVCDIQLIQHDHLVVAMIAEETLEADRTEIILAESFYFLGRVQLALGGGQ